MTSFKVLRFLDGESSEDLRARWSRAMADGAAVPGRPTRLIVALSLLESGFPPPRFTAVDIQWFASADDALANEDWLAGVEPDLCLGSPSLGTTSCRVVASEQVLRGADALAHLHGAESELPTMMMSFAKRRPGLTLTRFLDRWRDEAGRLGGTDIPEQIRGLAYVQNHPLVRVGHEWPFDAVNEVYLTHLEDLRRRSDWFAARQGGAVRTGEGIFDPDTTGSLFLRLLPVPMPS